MLNFTDIPPLGAAPVHANGQKDMSKLIGAFHDYLKASTLPVAQRDNKLFVIMKAESLFKRTYNLRLF
jgi:hypothetical protein